MPHLLPFYFVNQLSFTFLVLIITIFALSKYILPNYLILQVARTYLAKI